MRVEFSIAYEDMDLVTEFAAKLDAREKAREAEDERKWQEHLTATAEGAAAKIDRLIESEIEIVVEPEVSEQEATDALHQYVAKHGAAAALSLFAAYGAKRLGEVPSDRRAEVVGKMKEAL